MKNTAREVVDKMFTTFASGDVDGFVATVSEDTVWIYHGTQIIPAGVFEKKEGVKTFFTNIMERTEIINFEPQEFIVEGNKVVVLGREHQKVMRCGRALRHEWAHGNAVVDQPINSRKEFAVPQDVCVTGRLTR